MPDLVITLLRDGYRAVEHDRRARGGGVTHETRLLGRRAVVLGDADGARLFYDDAVVQRAGAVPPPLAWLLFGRGAVHGLDDDHHARRKAFFLDRLAPDRAATCAGTIGTLLREEAEGRRGREIELHPLLVRVYGRGVLGWVGASVERAEAESLGAEYARIVDGFGFAGRAYPRAWAARRRTDAWARRLIDGVRAGRVAVPEGSVVEALAASELATPTAAVELGNVVRPTIAVSWLAVFGVLALDGVARRDWWTEQLAAGERTASWAFAQEVRRTTPFVPALAGRVRRPASHDGVELRPGDRVVLDVGRINHDPEVWEHPEEFRPRRFLTREPSLYDLVPQGGGPPTGHRCPGESLTMMVLAETLQVLAGLLPEPTEAAVDVDLGRIPTLPAHGLRVRFPAPA